MGLRKIVGRCGKLCRDLQRELRLEVDGKHVELPPVEGIIILNILRFETFDGMILLIGKEILT